ncbi:HDOD domain-containing protein [Aquabacterium sp.]|uniref:HDOD domain-containing protein n=1 Tax=Aquabacterium sp. TaxID=1872578 RepID=UPI002B98D5A5|nr:HDOD domain-containing protein [Aquabacterium sp.]HSW06626.1 HDOD domain-containing protein [Aquabacterium sp.]
MLQSLFDRLLGRRPAVTAPRGTVRVVHAGTAKPPAAAPAPSAVPIGARRPLVSTQGGIAGFEFHLGEATLRRLRSRGDPAAATACASSLLGAMRLCAQNGQAAYGELPASWLTRGSTADPLISGMHLALVDDDDKADAAVLAQRIALWRGAGAAIGWAQGTAPRFATGLRPDFHTLQARALEPAALLQALRSGAPGVSLIALDLPGIDALEAALAAGVRLACCHIDAGVEPPEARPLTPQTQRLLALMTQLTRDAETPALVAAIKADVSLSYRLLRQLNSASVSPAGELGSIEQAVALLGRNELYRWVSVLLVQQAPARPASAALQAMALARARFFELLAEAQGEARPGALFTLGLASMLPQLLRTRLPDALASLQLHPQAEQALLERQGPWCAYLALAEVLDESDLEEATPLAQAFGGLPAVMAHSARAWMFATRLPSATGG